MNELAKFLVDSILGEATSIDNVIVVYSGRFQPFHKGHYATYSHLVKKFGKNNVYIGTSDKTDNQKSPFNFKEKHLVMTKMFGIPSNRIVNVKNPYVPTEILNKFAETTTAFVTVVGEKDSSRLGGKYFEKYKDSIEFEGYKDRGYVYVAPAQPNPISGTDVRIGLKRGSDEDKKNFFTKRAYGKFDDRIYNLITSKLAKLPEISEQNIWIPKHIVETWLVNNFDLIIEATTTTTSGGDVDDGPNFFFSSFASFDKISEKRAIQIGYSVLSQIMSDELTDIDPHPIYPNGPVKAVTPFPAGVVGKTTPTNQKDFYGDVAYPKWFKHVTRAAALVGYSLVDSTLTQKDKEEALKIQKIPSLPLPIVDENIDIPVKIGDTILTGKFKNKKTVVKVIGTDDHGMPTINGKKVVNFRMIKEGTLNEIPMADLVQIDRYADRQLNPVDVVITDKHFFDRLGDPRNEKPISAAELTGFFKRLAKNKKKFLDFINQYGQIVAKDNRTNINIPFMKQANKLIAKTIMRKDNYMTSNPTYKFEDIREASDIGGLGGGNNSPRWTATGQSKKLKIPQLSGYEQTHFPIADELDISKEKYGWAGVGKTKKYNNKIRAIRKDDGTLVFEDVIPGGLAQGLNLTDIANKHKVDIDELMKEFQMGIKVEMEHTTDRKVAEEIALDHLVEDPNYYTKLATVEEYAKYRTHIKHAADRGGLVDKLNELTKGQIFGGKIKIGGTSVPVEVELLGADNTKKVFITKIINIDKQYLRKLPPNGILEIPARIFRTPGGGWYRIKTPKAFENLMFGYPDQAWMDTHEKELKRLRGKFDKEKGKDQYYEPALGGGISERVEGGKVICDSCGWSWYISDGGKSPYTCHKCGTNNNPKLTEGTVVDGEPETGYIPDGKIRTVGHKGRPEPWYEQGGYSQLHFPKADAMRGKGKNKDKESSFRKVTYKTSNVKVSALKKALKPVGSDEWTEIPLKEGLLTEGGAYGHMNHPFDTEINLTFGQLKDIVNRALDGELELTREKTDGQALAISWVNGKLVAARNKGHLANKGANALDIKGVATKFSGRGELEKAYNFAMNDLSKAIGSLSEKQREKVFKNGACFMNLEVIYPTSVNVIPYGQPLLVFHGTMEYNEKGEAIGENQDAAKILAGMIKQVNQNVQSNYTIQGPPVTQLPKDKNLSSLKGKYNSQISKLQSQFKLSDNDGIGEYHQAWWTNFVQKKAPSAVDNTTLMGLVKRWAFYDKGFRLDSKTIVDPKVLAWAQKTDKEDHANIAKNNIRPFEDIFLGVGSDVLSFMSSVLTVNPDSAIRNMKQRLDQTIKDVQTGGDSKKIAKLKLELERLNAIGGKDKIVPNEGIVFVYGGKTFKLTGTFAPLNQILGLFY